MMRKNKPILNMKIFTSDELPFESRILNFVCFIGALAAGAAMIARIAEGMPPITIFTMVVMIVSIVIALCFSVLRAKSVKAVTVIVVYGLGVILFPTLYFTNGGSDSGLIAYFVMTIILDFLLLKGKTRVVGLVLTSLITVFCYVATMFWGWEVIPAGGLDVRQRFIDIIQSIFISGFFTGFVIVFQNHVYLREKYKAETASAKIKRSERLLKLVNEAANLLLTAAPTNFEEVLTESMGIMAAGLEFDRVSIWRRDAGEGTGRYCRAYQWVSDETAKPGPGHFADVVERITEVDGIFKERNYYSAARPDFPGSICQFLAATGIQSMAAFPIWHQDQIGGFILFGNCHSETLCSEQEIAILRSGSILLANSIERNENLLARDTIEQELAGALEQAVGASRAKGEFLSRMSHEMRTPMNAVIGMTGIAMRAGNIEKKDDCLEKIAGASKHLLSVINNILDMSKIEANKFELAPHPFNLEHMLEDVANVQLFRMDEKQQELVVNLDADIPQTVVGDSLRLAQVLTNLLANAIKFTPEQGMVTLRVTCASQCPDHLDVRMEVADTGIGISKEQQARLFTAFEQADGSTARKYGGTGLGLSISKHIVEMMGGEIWIESELGKGATFIFTAKLGTDSPKPLSAALGANRAGLRVLVVDDAEPMRDYLAGLLPVLSVECDVAANGQEALERIRQNSGRPYSLFLVDWLMPEMDGIQLAKGMKALMPGAPVMLMVSGTAWNDGGDGGREAGIDGFIAKPLFPSALVNAIYGLVGQAGQAAAPVRLADQPVNYRGRHILVAEDIAINREIIAAILEETEIGIDFAENGLDAVRMFDEKPGRYSLVLMDMQMPEMDGVDATRILRAKIGGSREALPIVAMTANVFREDVEACMEAGMNGHLGKPLDVGDLMKVLREYVVPVGG